MALPNRDATGRHAAGGQRRLGDELQEIARPAPRGAARPRSTHAPGRVAVVVPTYDYARFLASALDSVLAQTVPAAEIIVVDDGSHDDPAAVVERYPGVRLIRQTHIGLGAARNAGWRAATSDFVVFLDADDRLRPEAIALNLEQFRTDPKCGLVYGAYCDVSAAAGWAAPVPVRPLGGDPVSCLLRGNVIGMHGSVMYRRPLLEELGGFDPALPACEDYDLYLRAALRTPIRCRPELVSDYVRHEKNMSRDTAMMLRFALTVLRHFAPLARTRPEWRAAMREGRAGLKQGYAGAWLHAYRRARAKPRRAELRRQGLLILRLAPLTLASLAAGEALAGLKRRLRRGLAALTRLRP